MNRYPFVLSLLILFGCASTPNSTVLPPLHLVLGLDGIGYSTVMKLYKGGYFRHFTQPQPMVALFPSISDPNWSRLLRAPLTDSYTKEHFDIKKRTSNGLGEHAGNLLNHLTTPAAYESGFDFKAEGPIEHLAIMTWTQSSAQYLLDVLEKELLETKNKDIFFAFIMNTDIIAHTQGEAAVLDYLATVDQRLTNLRHKIMAEYHRDLDVTIISDHGNFWVKPKMIDFESVLKSYNWNFADTLSNKKDYAFVAPEIIAFGAFYCLPGSQESLAHDLAQVDGVHVATAASSPNVIEVYSRNDHARIQVDSNQHTVQYKVISGHDPLGQSVFFKGKSLSWEDYFLKSYKSDYPYAAVRIWEGFYRNTIAPGSVLVSPKLGYVFTNKTLELLTSIKGLESTHGSLHKAETWGVVMSTKEVPFAIRPEDFGNVVSLVHYKSNLDTVKAAQAK